MSKKFAYKTIFIGMLLALLLAPGAEIYAQYYANGDCDGNGYGLTVADMVYLIRYLHSGGPAPTPLYEADLNGDCVIDEADAEVYVCIFEHGLAACVPVFPVPTCDEPDTVIGACCDSLRGCSVRSLAHCQQRGGVYYGDGTRCYPVSPCTVCGDADLSGGVDISDVVYLLGVIFTGGLLPTGGDANCDGSLDISDAVYVIGYIFTGGPAPCTSCK